jgi:DNA (cytosine-5)-methyltransferase 1
MNDAGSIEIKADAPIRVFDAFCGIGGFRHGLGRLGGFEFVGAADIDKPARNAYKGRFGHVPEHADIRGVSSKTQRQFDLYCGGFPCQAFSTAGKRMGFLDQVKGTLFFECARLADDFRPLCLFLENVKGFTTHDGGRTLSTAICTLEELGYDVEWQIVNGKYIEPQARERIYIIAHRRDLRWRRVFPLSELELADFRSRLDKETQEGIREHGRLQAGNPVHRAVDLGNRGTFGSRHIFDPDRATPTLVTSDDLGFVKDADVRLSEFIPDLAYSTKIRRATEVERERLMGFPDGWTATDGNSGRQRVKQTGNAVIATVIQFIGERLKESILLARASAA